MTEISVFRPGDVSYLRIAAPDPARSAAFYNVVFGWKIRKDNTAFEDGTGHIIGHFMPDLPVAGEARGYSLRVRAGHRRGSDPGPGGRRRGDHQAVSRR